MYTRTDYNIDHFSNKDLIMSYDSVVFANIETTLVTNHYISFYFDTHHLTRFMQYLIHSDHVILLIV